MHFVSPSYLLFLVAILGAYFVLQPGGRFRQQNYLLLLASYVFYAWLDWSYALVLVAATAVNFITAQRIHRGEARRRWLRIGLAFNLGLLCYFKYRGFFFENAAQVLAGLGMDVSWSIEHLWLPLGISFFTFQNLGYLLDVYHRKIDPVDDLPGFALFVAFFPQLIMGPIERAKQLVPQIQRARTPTMASFRGGAWLILLGLTKKIVVADPIGRMVAPLFPTHTADSTYLSGHVVAGALLFTLQIYVDFASYTDIARGSARMLGFELTRNFRSPYLANNLREFWARWHISLSAWINDYLYSWLAVNPRFNRVLRTSGLLLVTMLVMGVWHGANWVFVAWGVYHGLLLVAYHRSRPFLHRNTRFTTNIGRRVWLGLSIAATFGVVTFGEVLFRSASIGQAMAMYRDLFSNPGMNASALASLLQGLRLYALVLALDILDVRSGDDDAILKWPWPWRRLVQFGMCYLLIHSLADSTTETADYHYFQF